VETPKPPPRCATCGKVILATHAEALREVTRLRMENGYYREEYRCPDALGGWHLRDLMKRYEKIKGQIGDETNVILQKIRRLDDLVPEDAHRAKSRKARRGTLENALRKLPPSGKKSMGRRGQLQRAKRHHREDSEARTRGTRGTSVNNELRRRTERARLREELRKEKDG
jgi:hypothetical protein